MSHSSLLTASTSATTASQVSQVTSKEKTVGPELTLSATSYNVSTNETIPIRLDLEKNTLLKVATLLNGKLTKSENFDIKRRRFVYMLTPDPGVNTLRFTLLNSEGDSTVREVTVVYTPEAVPITSLPRQGNPCCPTVIGIGELPPWPAETLKNSYGV